MNSRHLTRIALLAASKRLGRVRASGHRRVFTHVHRANNGVTHPVHTGSNTYEPNRDVLTSKQNRIPIGTNTNNIVSPYDYTVNAIGQRVSRTQSGTAFDGIGYAPGTQLPRNYHWDLDMNAILGLQGWF